MLLTRQLLLITKLGLSLYSLIWDFLLSQINIRTTTVSWSNIWAVLPKPSWYEFLIGFLIWTPTYFKVFASYNLLQYLCDFIYVLIFVIVSKMPKKSQVNEYSDDHHKFMKLSKTCKAYFPTCLQFQSNVNLMYKSWHCCHYKSLTLMEIHHNKITTSNWMFEFKVVPIQQTCTRAKYHWFQKCC